MCYRELVRGVATCLFGALAGLLGVPSVAGATWSIVAVDPETQEVGVAVASCVEAPFGTTLLPQVAALAPGVGALAAQALFSQQTRDEALALLAGGATPQEVIDMVTAGDGGSAVRQYGVVTLDLQVAAFTGAATEDWAGDGQGRGVTVQGNILYGPEVVADALAAFEGEGPACPWTLGDRLMVALEAGGAQGGDNRCSEEQAALAAVLVVARPGDEPDAPTIDIRIPSQDHGGPNPVALLRTAYDAWRLDNPPDDAECGGDSSSGGVDDTAGTSDASTGAVGSTGGPLPTTGGAPTGDGTAGTGDGAGSSVEAEGCGCRSTRSRWWSWLVLIAPFLLRRRTRNGRVVSRPSSRW